MCIVCKYIHLFELAATFSLHISHISIFAKHEKIFLTLYV